MFRKINACSYFKVTLPGVPKKTIHCLISYDVKPIKAILIKQKAFHSLRINLDFNTSQFIFHAILTKIQVFEVARGFRNWRRNDKNCRIKVH